MTTEPTHLHAAGPLPAPLAPGIHAASADVAAPAEAAPAVGRAAGSSRAAWFVGRAIYIATALWIFLTAIDAMKTGARALAPALQGSALTDTLASTLGFGWLGAMLVMSGSPVAASALALLDGGAVSAPQALTMLTGSRLGAAFVVLTVAFLYALRGKASGDARRASLSIGIFSLLLTAVVYVPALAIGLPLLHSDVMYSLATAAPVHMFDFVAAFTDPAVAMIQAQVPDIMLFFTGLVLLLVAVRMFDKALPHADNAVQEHTDWRNRRWLMFGLGSLVALVTMSVSVALTVLVPAVAKGYLRRRQALPYIMGANITTLGDTLVTAFIIGNPMGVRVVAAELVGIIGITVLLLAFLYTPLTERVVRVTDWVLDSRTRLASFVAALFCVPISLIWLA